MIDARWIVLPLVVALSGCANLTAISTFSKSAPDIANLDKLTGVYVEDPQVQATWLSLSQPGDLLHPALVETRLEQKVALDQLHGLIVDYMRALGDVSGAKLTDLSAQSKVVSGNLSTLQKKGLISITADQVAAIGDIATIVPQNILNLYRAHQVARIIRDNQKAFDAMVDVEIGVVADVYILDYKTTATTITSQRDFIEMGPSSSGANSLAPVTKFLFEKEASRDVGRLDRARVAATQYVVALEKLKAAYDALVEEDGKFDERTLLALAPYLSAAAKAYTDVNAI